MIQHSREQQCRRSVEIALLSREHSRLWVEGARSEGSRHLHGHELSSAGVSEHTAHRSI